MHLLRSAGARPHLDGAPPYAQPGARRGRYRASNQICRHLWRPWRSPHGHRNLPRAPTSTGLDRAANREVLRYLVWAAAITTWVVSRFTRGHEIIASVARRVTEGDLSARIDTNLGEQDMVQL